MQSHRLSMIETVCNVIGGYVMAVVLQVILLPMFGLHIELRQNMMLAVPFVVASMIRSYAFRRFFNWLSVRGVR